MADEDEFEDDSGPRQSVAAELAERKKLASAILSRGVGESIDQLTVVEPSEMKSIIRRYVPVPAWQEILMSCVQRAQRDYSYLYFIIRLKNGDEEVKKVALDLRTNNAFLNVFERFLTISPLRMFTVDLKDPISATAYMNEGSRVREVIRRRQRLEDAL